MLCRFCGLDTGEPTHHRSEAECNKALDAYIAVLKEHLQKAAKTRLPPFTAGDESPTAPPRVGINRP